jgi:nitrite reductase/ring-hydroxylating ferredoxin subunit
MTETRVLHRRNRRLFAALSEDVPNGGYIKCKLLYKGLPDSIIVLRLDGVIRGYRNRCVHMPRELDCEADTVFGGSGFQLRCSMHGIVYDPEDGRSLSTLCFGQKLTVVTLVEEEGAIWITDKRVRPAPDPTPISADQASTD